jgi:hypothetical protein
MAEYDVVNLIELFCRNNCVGTLRKQNAKIWIRRLCIQAVVQLSNTAALSFSDIAK